MIKFNIDITLLQLNNFKQLYSEFIRLTIWLFKKIYYDLWIRESPYLSTRNRLEPERKALFMQ